MSDVPGTMDENLRWPRGKSPTGPIHFGGGPAEPAFTALTRYPIPPGRGRWRFVLVNRRFTASGPIDPYVVTELPFARSRRLEQAWNTPARLTFTLNAGDPAASLIEEFRQDVIAFRWNDLTGADVAVFRGPVTAALDTLTEQSATINLTCQDYLAVLQRRLLTVSASYAAYDQDLIVSNLLANATTYARTSTPLPSGTPFGAASYLPLLYSINAPNGSSRPTYSGRYRDRAYTANSRIGELIDNLAKVIDGFDYAVVPNQTLTGGDWLRIYYPYQGVERSDVVLQYGSTVSGLTRNITSGDYANYVRVVGDSAEGKGAFTGNIHGFDPPGAHPAGGYYIRASGGPFVQSGAGQTQFRVNPPSGPLLPQYASADGGYADLFVAAGTWDPLGGPGTYTISCSLVSGGTVQGTGQFFVGNYDSGQLFAEAWNTDAMDAGIRAGPWMMPDSAPDVSIPATLQEQADGDLALYGMPVPSYSLTMRPDVYLWGYPNMGDVVPLIIQAGRLNVNTMARVVGITYDIGDDGQEDVVLAVGRPDTTLANLFTSTDTTVAALARR